MLLQADAAATKRGRTARNIVRAEAPFASCAAELTTRALISLGAALHRDPIYAAEDAHNVVHTTRCQHRCSPALDDQY